MQGAMVEGVDPLGLRLGIAMDDKIDTVFRRNPVAQRLDGLEFPCRVDMQQRKGQRAGKEGLAGKVQHHRAVLADRIKHHRALGFGHRLPKDVDCFGFQPVEMVEPAHARSMSSRWLGDKASRKRKAPASIAGRGLFPGVPCA